MNARTTPEIDSPRQLRAQRRAAALVAEYIHELSDRHGGPRHGSQVAGGRTPTGSGEDDTIESQGG